MVTVFCRGCGRSTRMPLEEARVADLYCERCAVDEHGCDECGDPICEEAREAGCAYCADCWAEIDA